MLKPEHLPPFATVYGGARFVGLDFDGTIAQTFKPSPHNIDVETAYLAAVDVVFGAKGLAQYQHEGGLRNRAPAEIIRQLAPDASNVDHANLLPLLVTKKLAVLVDEISPEWPEPTDGYRHFEAALSTHPNRDDISRVIVSSGHDPFIQRTYETWGIPMPEVIVAQEKLSEIAANSGETLPDKPDRRVMEYAHMAWRGMASIVEARKSFQQDIPRMLYVGDGTADAELAASTGVRFFHIRAEQSAQTWARVLRYIGANRAS